MKNDANIWSQSSDGPSTPTTTFGTDHTKSMPVFNVTQNLDQPSFEAFFDNFSLENQQMLQTSHTNQLGQRTVEEEHFFAYSGIEYQPFGSLVTNNNLARPTPTGVSEYVGSTAYNNLRPTENITSTVPLRSSICYPHTEESITYAHAESSLPYCSTQCLLTNTNLQIPHQARPFPTSSWPYTNVRPSQACTSSGPSLQSNSLSSLPYSSAGSPLSINHQTNTSTGPSLYTTNSGYSLRNANKFINTNQEFLFPNINSGTSLAQSHSEPSLLSNAGSPLGIDNPGSSLTNLNSRAALCNDPWSIPYTSAGPLLAQSSTDSSLFNSSGPLLGMNDPGSSLTNLDSRASLSNDPWSTLYTSAGPSFYTNSGSYNSTWPSLLNSTKTSITTFNSEPSLTHIKRWPSPSPTRTRALLYTNTDTSLTNYRTGLSCYTNTELSFSNTNTNLPLPNASADHLLYIQTETPLNVVNADHLCSSIKIEPYHLCATSQMRNLRFSTKYELQADAGQRSERVFHFTGSSAISEACKKHSRDDDNSSTVTSVQDESECYKQQASKTVCCDFESVETIGIQTEFVQSSPFTSWDMWPGFECIEQSSVDSEAVKFDEDAHCNSRDLDLLRVVDLSVSKEELLKKNFNAVSSFIASAPESPKDQLDNADDEASVEVLKVVHLNSKIVADSSFHSATAKLIDLPNQPEKKCKDSSGLNLWSSIISQSLVESQESSDGVCNVTSDEPDIPNDSSKELNKFDIQADTKPSLTKSCFVKVCNVFDELNQLKQKLKETNIATCQVAAKPAICLRDCFVKVSDIFLDGTLDLLKYSKSPKLRRLISKNVEKKLDVKNLKSLKNLRNGLVLSVGSSTRDKKNIKKEGQKVFNLKTALKEPTDETSRSNQTVPTLSAGLLVTKPDCFTATTTIKFKPIATVPKTKSKLNEAPTRSKPKTIAAVPRTKSEPNATLKRKKLETSATLPKSKRKQMLAVPSDKLKPIAVEPTIKGKSNAAGLATKLKQIAAMPTTKWKPVAADLKSKWKRILATSSKKLKPMPSKPTTKPGPIAAVPNTNFKIPKKNVESIANAPTAVLNPIAVTPKTGLEAIAAFPRTNLDPTAAISSSKLESIAATLKIKLESIAAIPITKFDPIAAAPTTCQPVKTVPKTESETITALRNTNRGPILGIPTSLMAENSGLSKADLVVIAELPPVQMATTQTKQIALSLMKKLEPITAAPIQASPIQADGNRVSPSVEPISDTVLPPVQHHRGADFSECQLEVLMYRPSPLEQGPQFAEAVEPSVSPLPPLSSMAPSPLPQLPSHPMVEPYQPLPLEQGPQFPEAIKPPVSPLPPPPPVAPPSLPSLTPPVSMTTHASWVPYQPSSLKPWPKFSNIVAMALPLLSSIIPPPLPPIPCKELQSDRGELAELQCPFVSDNPHENADNCAQGWDVLRFVRSERESFEVVRRRWGHPSLPNPNRDLSFRFKRFELFKVHKSTSLHGDLQSLNGGTPSLSDDLRSPQHHSPAMHCELQSTQNDLRFNNGESQSEHLGNNFSQAEPYTKSDIDQKCLAPAARQPLLPNPVVGQRHHIQARRMLTSATDKNIVITAQNSAFAGVLEPSGVSVAAGSNAPAVDRKSVSVKRKHSGGGSAGEPAAKRARLIPCTMLYAQKLQQVQSAVQICRGRLAANGAQSHKPGVAQLRRLALQQRQWERASQSEQVCQRIREVLTLAVTDVQLFRSFYQDAEKGKENTFYLTEREAGEALEQDRYYTDMMRVYNYPKSSSKCLTSQPQP